ncbi:MAG: alpha/beta hydrolase [Gammaproteobacteria bacterium]|nr:alpha/beta hydrolase [Gammaproteobacteria bacterium]MDH4315390.1 alpha/beta hydrolase [Gammaproteobacteria bacterium]MDH5214095.1 alpha/beta hydrolase [Gammaproteobacteria bacterium]
MTRKAFPVFLAAFLYSSVCAGETYVIPFDDLRGVVDNSEAPPDQAIANYLAGLLRDQLAELGFDIQGGSALGEFPVDEVTEIIDTSCPIPSPYEVHTDATTATVTLDPDSSISIVLDSLDSISITADLNGVVTASSPAWVRWGQNIPFGTRCAKFDTDHGWVAVRVPFALDIDLQLSLFPSYDPDQVAIVVDKFATIGGDVQIGAATLDYDFGYISLTELVLAFIEDALVADVAIQGEQAIDDAIIALNYRLDGLDENGMPDATINAFNGPTVFALEYDADDEAFINDLLATFGIPEIVIEMLGDRGIELLLQLAILQGDDREAYLTALGAEVGCTALFGNFRTVLERVPLYSQDGGSCQVAEVVGPPATAYFADAYCTTEVAFSPSDEAEFCQSRFGSQSEQLLGNASAWTADAGQPGDPLPAVPSRAWTVVPSSELDLGTVSIANNLLPYMKQLQYKSIENLSAGSGTCELEMRVYKSDIQATDLKPLLAFHGGTWKSRGFSFFGLEAGISHFTSRGFIVFAPFYRLAGRSDGNVECNGASWREITADVESALDWVETYGADLGASDEAVTVFGQSAGAHLAAWLASHEAGRIRKALLYYGPLDALDFLADSEDSTGPLAGFRDFGLRSLATLYGALGGTQELRLNLMGFAGITTELLSSDWQNLIPDTVFNITGVPVSDPSPYLSRCAALTGIDLASINFAQPPATLLTCLKEDLRDFLVENSFFDKLGDESVPVFALHGTADTLVPYSQPVKMCGRINNTLLPTDIDDAQTIYSCGYDSEVRIIRDAEHALDLGFCVDSLCPSGADNSEIRMATAAAMSASYEWMLVDPTTFSASVPILVPIAPKRPGVGIIKVKKEEPVIVPPKPVSGRRMPTPGHGSRLRKQVRR